MEKQTFTTREFMDVCHITHPNKVSMLVKEGVVKPHKQPDNLRSYYFTQRDVDKAARYLKGKTRQRTPLAAKEPDLHKLLAANKALLSELETLKEKLETVLNELL